MCDKIILPTILQQKSGINIIDHLGFNTTQPKPWQAYNYLDTCMGEGFISCSSFTVDQTVDIALPAEQAVINLSLTAAVSLSSVNLYSKYNKDILPFLVRKKVGRRLQHLLPWQQSKHSTSTLIAVHIPQAHIFNLQPLYEKMPQNDSRYKQINILSFVTSIKEQENNSVNKENIVNK